MFHIHWLKNHIWIFNNNGKDFYIAQCRCGKRFFTTSKFPITIFIIELRQ